MVRPFFFEKFSFWESHGGWKKFENSQFIKTAILVLSILKNVKKIMNPVRNLAFIFLNHDLVSVFFYVFWKMSKFLKRRKFWRGPILIGSKFVLNLKTKINHDLNKPFL